MDIADDAESCPPPPPTTHFSYKGDSPWAAPPVAEADATVFHVESTSNAPPKIQHFIGTINLGFAIVEYKRNDMNVALLLKQFMYFTKQTNPDFRIDPLNGQGQCIFNPSNILTSKDGMELYYQHRVVTYGIRGKNNVAMYRTMGEMKDPATPLRKYFNQEKVYVSPSVLGLVDTRIIGVMLQTYPMLTFRDNIKSSIMDIMSDNTSLTVFSKCVRELKPENDNPRFTNALAIQVAIKDGKTTKAYTEKLYKAMEYVNEHGNHPVLSQCVFVSFGYGAAIEQNTFCSLIPIQNEFLHNIKHIEIHGLSDSINDEDG
jgi:hypothetical protein